MFTYLDNDDLDEFNVFADVDSSSQSLFDHINPFDPHTSPAYTKFSEGVQALPDRAFSPLDTSSDFSSSQSVSTPEAGDDSDSNHSISENTNIFTSHFENDVDTSINYARRRSWRSFRRAMIPIIAQPKFPRWPSIFYGSDQDADGESDDAGSDDEYIPSPDLDIQTIQNLKRRRSASLPRRAETSARPLPLNSTYSSHSTAKRVRLASPSRNKQASQASSVVITRVVNNNLIEQTKFICPECGWRQINKRVPDFKRHLKTHLRPKDNDHSSGYWCKGVRVEDVSQYAIHPDAISYRFQDQERIGGCMRTFSRRDALKRHLDNTKILCVGEMLD